MLKRHGCFVGKHRAREIRLKIRCTSATQVTYFSHAHYSQDIYDVISHSFRVVWPDSQFVYITRMTLHYGLRYALYFLVLRTTFSHSVCTVLIYKMLLLTLKHKIHTCMLMPPCNIPYWYRPYKWCKMFQVVFHCHCYGLAAMTTSC